MTNKVEQHSSGSRGLKHLRILTSAFRQSISSTSKPPGLNPERVLVAHNLLLGDTLMLAALFATLRSRYPDAEIYTTVNPLYLPLFSAQPYGVIALPYDPRDSKCIKNLLEESKRGGFDLACVPGDNRYALLARAMGARWIFAMAGDTPEWKNRICDAEVTWPSKPTALPECFARMAGIRDPRSSDRPLYYQVGDWPSPTDATVFVPPNYQYVVLHVSARSPLRQWEPAKWRQLADSLEQQGLTPIWSAGPGEAQTIEEIDGLACYSAQMGDLSLSDLWRFFAAAKLVVCLDTGVAHMAKLIGVPTLCLYGPGSPQLFGAGEFFAGMPFMAVGAQRFQCRDQKTIFQRNISWVRRCERTPKECSEAKCMNDITVDDVLGAARRLFDETEK